MKLTPILLIPPLFLSSCTIDWNDEKDKKITELEKQVTSIKEKNTQLEKNLSGTLSSINDERKRRETSQTELDNITIKINTELQERMSKDTTLENHIGEYAYKNEVFDGKNTGICYISSNNNMTTFDKKKQVFEKCKPGNIVLEQGESTIDNCILSPDGTHYIFPIHSTDTNWKTIGEYYKTTSKYVLFFYKRGEYCNKLIQVNPSKFRTGMVNVPGVNYEYGTDGNKLYFYLGIFDSMRELEKSINKDIKDEEIRMIELQKQNNSNSN